ncbi:DNA or RNA helicase of superfamily II [Rubidibacter lacunae KORDI 51-2]|uniref:DNA 3'-5' helicase n=1 Tax=Rubidibacter lacunae KORDI 51-2 TaxID=582515 RepID=U5DK71_9CHRO|nr:DEAD/DEAH box helicase family protein [Rubidibacter lacunae]ERN41312.1 DNA or RNA helicase of superfamily II [Rubidibacter lacunae KORDI 51-2]
MGRTPELTYDRGTLLLHPPPRGKAWIDFATWDDRVEKFRFPALHYRALVGALQRDRAVFNDRAPDFPTADLMPVAVREPFVHQREALAAWEQSGRRGVVVLPTGAGKTYFAQLAMQAAGCSTMVVVPTIDLLHQWYAQLEATYPGADIGALGGGACDRAPILVATYDSAAIHAESLGNRYGLLVCDECHHLPTEFYRVVAEYAIAPYRLGLTATPERSDNAHRDLDTLLGPMLYRKSAAELSGTTLAAHDIVRISVELSAAERERYDAAIACRNGFLREAKISLGSLKGWQRFVQIGARSAAGRRAMLAHREARELALGTDGKLHVLGELLARHYPERTLIFTNDNATVYRIAQEFLIPAITHQTPVKERHAILQAFQAGVYPTIATSRVLNEGVDVPDARIAIVLSGTSSTREYVQRLGRILRKGSSDRKLALLYELIAADTSEERIAARRRATYDTPQQLPISPLKPVAVDAASGDRSRLRVAEAKGTYKAEPEFTSES